MITQADQTAALHDDSCRAQSDASMMRILGVGKVKVASRLAGERLTLTERSESQQSTEAAPPKLLRQPESSLFVCASLALCRRTVCAKSCSLFCPKESVGHQRAEVALCASRKQSYTMIEGESCQ